MDILHLPINSLFLLRHQGLLVANNESVGAKFALVFHKPLQGATKSMRK
jgi:hypothetical protein